jgi:hypothetical protein
MDSQSAAKGCGARRVGHARWYPVLDEAEAVLDGKELIPHWRFSKGIEMKAFFNAPQTFDLVLLLTRQGALPYLADGEVITAERWRPMTRDFEARFFEYTLRFN